MSRRLKVLTRLAGRGQVRALEAAFSAFNIAEYGAWVAILVYAYERGGAAEASVVAVCQLLPAALVAPLAARAVDSRGAAASLRCGYACQAAAYGITAALLFAAAPALIVYLAAAIAASAVTVTRPAHAGMVPALASDSEDLTAITVLSGWVESASVLTGPAVAGLLIGLDGPAAAIALFAAALLLAAVFVHCSLPWRQAAPEAPRAEQPTGRRITQPLRENPGLTRLVVLLGAQYLVIGVLDVVLVVLAIGALDLGASGAGYLTAAFGAGGVLGSVAAVWLIGRRRLARPLGAAAVVWAGALIMLGAWPSVAGAFLLLAVAGSARSLFDTTGRTILLRAAPTAVRGQVFGLLEGISMFALAVGAALVPALVALGGPGAALMATGLMLCAITVGVAAAVHQVDRAGANRRSPSPQRNGGEAGMILIRHSSG